MFVRKGRKRGAILNGKVEPLVLDRNLNLSQVNLVAPCLVEEEFLLFDVDTYLQDYPDVKDSYTKEKYALGQGKHEIINKDLVYNHFLRFGRHEGRIAYGIKENGEKVRFTTFNHDDYVKVCEDAYNKGVNNEINGTLHYKKNEVKPKRIIVNECAKVFPDAFRNNEFIKMLKQEWANFHTWKYKKDHGKNGSAKILFIDYISSHFEPLMAPIKEAERKLALQKEAERKVCIIYVYYERKNETKSQTNLAYFIKYGLDSSRWRNMDITTLIMINGRQCEITLPDRPNFHIQYVDYDDNNNNLYKQGIDYLNSKYGTIHLKTHFSSLYLLNSNTFGPIYHEGKDRHWTDALTKNSHLYSQMNDNNLLIFDCYNSAVFGSMNEEHLKATLDYKQAIFNIADYRKYFNKTTNNKCIIYSHFDSDNIIKQYVLESLVLFAQLGYDILFYTNSTSINNYDSSFLPFAINYYNDSNIGSGTDWCMWYTGCTRIMHEPFKYEWVTLINDSMLFNINGLENMRQTIEKIQTSNCDVWGHWDSNEINYHIMSSFIELKHIVLSYFIDFCDANLFECKTKLDVIFNCETKFVEYIQSHGFKTDVVIRSSILNNNCTTPSHNPLNIKKWINNPSCFGVKWKYIISYLENNQSFLNTEIKERLRYIHIGKTVGIKEITFS